MKKVIINLISIFLIISSYNVNGQNNPESLTREKLIKDTRQLIKIIEESHPEPYLNFGGKIAFHRNFQKILTSIPDTGMTSAEFYKLVMPFVAKLSDMHTGLISPLKPEQNGPGVPLKFKIIENDLIVTEIPDKKYDNLLGSRLVSVCGKRIDELLVRQSQLRGIENKYGELLFLSISLKSRNGIKSLIPEWDSNKITAEFKLVSGNTSKKDFLIGENNLEDKITFPSRQIKPSTKKSDVVYDFTDAKKETALLVISNMERYREASEAWFSENMEGALEYSAIAFQHFNDTTPPDDTLKLLKGIPSAVSC